MRAAARSALGQLALVMAIMAGLHGVAPPPLKAVGPDDTVEALANLVRPPERPARPAVIDWEEFERRDGFSAPADYRALLERYGVGAFGTAGSGHGWLDLIEPFDPASSLVERSDWQRRNARGLQRQFPEQYPGWPVWPAEGGLLPWATSIDGDLIGWWTGGPPDTWGIRVFGRDAGFEEFPFGAAEFVLRLVTGDITTVSHGAFSAPGVGDPPRFYPRSGAPVPDDGAARQDVWVTFAGISPLVDRDALIASYRDAGTGRVPTDETERRVEMIMRPADEIIDAWAERAREQGVDMTARGVSGDWTTGEVHHEVSVTFLSDSDPIAKGLIVELSGALGVTVRDVRDLEFDVVWEDISERH